MTLTFLDLKLYDFGGSDLICFTPVEGGGYIFFTLLKKRRVVVF